MSDAMSLNPVVQVREVFESLPDVLRVPIEMVVFGGELPRADISRMRWMAAQLRGNSSALVEHAEDVEGILARQSSVGEFGNGLRAALHQQRDGAGQLGEQASALADQCAAAANEAEKHLCVMFVFAIDLAWRVFRMVAAGSATGPAGQVTAAAMVQKSLIEGRVKVGGMRAALKQAYEQIAAATAARMPAVSPAQFAVAVGKASVFPAGVDAGVQGLQVAAGHRDLSLIGEEGTNPTGIDLTSIGLAAAAGAAGAAGGMLAARFGPSIFPAMQNSRMLTGLVHGTAGAVAGLSATALIAGWPQHYQDILAPLLNGGFAGAVYARADMQPQLATTPEFGTPSQVADGSGSFVPSSTGRTDSGRPSPANEISSPRPAVEVSPEARQMWAGARAAWAPVPETTHAPGAPGTVDAAARTGTAVLSESGSPPPTERSAPHAEAAMPNGEPRLPGRLEAPQHSEPSAVGPPEASEAAGHSDTATAAAGPTESIATGPRPEIVPTGRTESTGATTRPDSAGAAGRSGATERIAPSGTHRSESTAPAEGARRQVADSRPATPVPRVEAGGETAPPQRVTEPALARAGSPAAEIPAAGTPHTRGSENSGEHSTTHGEPAKYRTPESFDSATETGDRIEPGTTTGELTRSRSGEEGHATARDMVAAGSDDTALPGAGRVADSGDGHAPAGEPVDRISEAGSPRTSDAADAPASTSRDRAGEVLADFYARSAEHIPEQQRLSNLSDEAVQAGLFHGTERDSLIAGMEIIRRQTVSVNVPGGMVLRNTQLEGAIELAAGRPVQMLPGQGKTLMFMLHTLTQAVHKGSVLLVTTADGLAHREVAEYRRVLEPFGIDVLRADQETGFGQVTPGRPAIVVATGETVGHLCNAGHTPPRRVVIDEMDAIVDRGEKTFIRSESESEAAPEGTAREVFGAHDFLTDALAQGQLSHEDFGLRRIAEEVDMVLPDGTLETGIEYWYDGQAALTASGRERVEALPGGQRWLQDMGLSRLETAAAAEFTTRNKTHYVVDEGKIVIIDQVEHGLQRNPKTSSETRWSAAEGKASLAQAVEAKEIRRAEAIGMDAEQHKIVVRADTESTKTITAAEIYGTERFFDRVTGASGTLTDLGSVLQTVYGLDTPHEVAPYNPSRLVEGAPDVHENTRAKLHALAGYAHDMWNGGKGRFQEILCHRNDLVEKQVNALLRAGVPREAIEAVDANRIAGWGAAWETKLQNVFDAAGEQGKILVINRQGQRGVHISVSEAVLAKGGMHVWMTEVPEQSYIYDQAKNRTARNGQPGTAQALMSPQDTLIRDAMHLRGVREAVVYYQKAVTDHHTNPNPETHNTLVQAGETLGSLVPGLQERAHHRTTADFLLRYAPITEPSALITAMTPWNPDEAELGAPDRPADRTTRLAGLVGVSPATLAAAAAAAEHSDAHTTDPPDHSRPASLRTDEPHTHETRDTGTRTAGHRTDETPDAIHRLLQHTGLPAAAVETLKQELDATAAGEAVRYALSTDEQALAHLLPRRDRLATELGWDIAAIEGAEGLRHLGTATTAAQHALAQALKAASVPGPELGQHVESPSESSFPGSDITIATAREILGEAIVGDLSLSGTDTHRPGTGTAPATVDPAATQSTLAADVVDAAAHYFATAALLDLATAIHRRSPNSCVNNGVTAMRVLFPGNADRFTMPSGGIPLRGHDWNTVRQSFRNGSPTVSTSLDTAVESLRHRPGGAQVLVYKWKNTENQGGTGADNHLVLLVNDSTDPDRPNLVAVDLSASHDGNYDNDFGPKDLADRRALLNRAVRFDTWRNEQRPYIQNLPESERAFWIIDFDNAGNLAPSPGARNAPHTETLHRRPAVNPGLQDAGKNALAALLVDSDAAPDLPDQPSSATPTVGTPDSRQRGEPVRTGSRPSPDRASSSSHIGSRPHPNDDADTFRRPIDSAATGQDGHTGHIGSRQDDSHATAPPRTGGDAEGRRGEDRIEARPTSWDRRDGSPDDVPRAAGADASGFSHRNEPGWRVRRLRDEVELARDLYHRPEVRQAAVAMLDRLREVLVALHPGATPEQIDSAFYAPENVAAGPMVPRSVPLEELRRDGNVRELMAAISNAILRSGELPEEYRSTTTLDDGIAALLNEQDWTEKAGNLGLDVEALRRVRETVTGGDPDAVVEKRKFRDVRNTVRYPEDLDIADERTRSSEAELERDRAEQIRRGLTVQDWQMLGMPLSLRELAAIPDDLIKLRKFRLDLHGRELPRDDRGQVDMDELESELEAQDQTFRFALPLYEFDDNGRRMRDEAGNAVVSGVLTYHEVGVVDAETALGLDPNEYAVPLPFGPGVARVAIAPDSQWYQEVVVEQGFPVLAGLSGTAGRFAARFKWLQPPGVSEVDFAGAILAFLSPQHHSLYEQVRGMQMSGLRLVDEAVLRSPRGAVSALYQAVFDRFGIPAPTGTAQVVPYSARVDRASAAQRVPAPEEGESLDEWADRAGSLAGLDVSRPLDDQYIQDWLTEHDEQVREWRRYIHHHPEASGNEYGTARYVFEVLREAGLDPELVLDGRGVICDFGPADGDRVVLRADMDALKMDVGGEEKVIHACGHDAHTAMVLAAGQALASNPERLEELGVGVRLVFQPAEETAEGAREMVEAGLLGGTDRAFALHCDPRLKAGEFGVVVGPMNASADKLTVEFAGEPTEYSAPNSTADRLAVDFHGPGGHTAHPEETADLIRAMSEFTATLDVLLTGHIGEDGAVETAFGQFRAGEKMNAIPDAGRVEGMIRRATVKYPIVHTFLHERLRELKQRFDGLTYTLEHEPEADPAGPGGQAGRPDGTVDLVRAMSEFARALDDALSERFEYGTIVTVFGKADAGYGNDARLGAGTLTGTVRRADVGKQDVEDFLDDRLAELEEQFPGLITRLHHDELVPTVVNDPESILLFLKAIAALGPHAAAPIDMSMGGDDFAHFLDHSPKSGAYVNVGIWSGEGRKYSLHQPPLGLDVDALDERALAYGARALAGTVLATGIVAGEGALGSIGSKPSAMPGTDPDEPPWVRLGGDITAGDNANARLVADRLITLLHDWPDPGYVRDITEAVTASVRWGVGVITVKAQLSPTGLHIRLIDITGDHSYVEVNWHLATTPGPVEHATRQPESRSAAELDAARMAEMYGEQYPVSAADDLDQLMAQFGDLDEEDSPASTSRGGNASPYQAEVAVIRNTVSDRLGQYDPPLPRTHIQDAQLAVSELVTNAKKHLHNKADDHGLAPEEVLGVSVTGTGSDRKLHISVTNELAPGTAAGLPKWTDEEQDHDREGGRGTQLVIGSGTVAVRRLTFADGKNTVEHSVEYWQTPPAGEIAATHSGTRPTSQESPRDGLPPGRIGSRPNDTQDLSAPGSAPGHVIVEALTAARAMLEQIVAGIGPVPHSALGAGLDLERLASMLSESDSGAALDHICRSRGFVGYAERVDARHFDEVIAAGGRAYFAVGETVADADTSPRPPAEPGRTVAEGSTVSRDIDHSALVWESRDAVEAQRGGSPGRAIRVAVRPIDVAALPERENLVAMQRSVRDAIADVRRSLAGAARASANKVQIRQLGYAEALVGDLDCFAAALGYRGYTLDDPTRPGHRSLRILDPGLVVQHSEISGTSGRSAPDSGDPKRYSAISDTDRTPGVVVPNAPGIDGIAVSARLSEWMMGFDRRPEAELVAAALAAQTETGQARPSNLAELLLSELRRCWDQVAEIPSHTRIDPEIEYPVVLAPSNPDSDSGKFVQATLDRYPQLRGSLVILSGGAPLIYSDGTRQPPKFPARDEAEWLLVGAERAGLSRTGSGAVEVILDRQARTSLQNVLHLQAIVKLSQYIDIDNLPEINNFLQLLEHEEFIDVDAPPTYLDREQRGAIAPLLYEDSSLLVVSRLFEDSGPPVNIAVISTDQHAGRLIPLIGKQVPAAGKIAMITPGSSLPAFLQDGLVTDPAKPSDPDFRVEAILLEVKGLVDYTRQGQILEQQLSADVTEAFNFMSTYYPQVFRHDQSRLLQHAIDPEEIRHTGEENGPLSEQQLKERMAALVEQLKSSINERTRQGVTRVWQEHADQAPAVLRSGRYHWLSDFAAWATQRFDWVPAELRAATGLDWGRALKALATDDLRLVGRLYRHYAVPGRIEAELTGEAESALHRLAHLVVSPNTAPADGNQPNSSPATVVPRNEQPGNGPGRIGSRPSPELDVGDENSGGTAATPYEASGRSSRYPIAAFVGFPDSQSYSAGRIPRHDTDEAHRVTRTPDGKNVFLGTLHRADSDHPQSRALAHVVEEWEHSTRGQRRVVAVAGRLGRIAGIESAEQAWDRGEMAFAEYFAFQHNIDRISLEEDPREQVEWLLVQGHDPEYLFFHHVVRMIPQGIRQGIDPTEVRMRAIDRNKWIVGENDTARATVLIDRILETDYAAMGFPRPFYAGDEDWILREQWDVLVTPYIAEPTGLQKVAFGVYRRREDYMTEMVNRLVADGNSILGLYGQAHHPFVLPNIPVFAGTVTTALPDSPAPAARVRHDRDDAPAGEGPAIHADIFATAPDGHIGSRSAPRDSRIESSSPVHPHGGSTTPWSPPSDRIVPNGHEQESGAAAPQKTPWSLRHADQGTSSTPGR